MVGPHLQTSFNPVIIVPTYNNSGTLPDILGRLARLNLPVIIIDDGSTDATARILADWRASAPGAGFRVLTHPANHGKAAALQTGFAAAGGSGFTHAVTIDSDGQLDPEQIPELLAVAARDPRTLVLGMRDIHRPDYPAKSRLGRQLSNFFIRMECGRRIEDSQCGFRVYPLALLQAVQCRAGRYGYETEIITKAAWAGYPIVEAPVNCRYFAGQQRISHFKVWRDTARGLALHARLLGTRLARLVHLARLIRPAAHGSRPASNHPESDHPITSRSWGRRQDADTPPRQSLFQVWTAIPATDLPTPGPILTGEALIAPPRELGVPEGGRQSAGGPLAPAGHATSWSSLSDRLLCPLLLVAGLLLRIGYAFKYRFNTDEPQHLHVAWSWTHGLVQYRDIFDNHTPLFHLLCAPLVYMLGDRADLLALMRLALIPIYVLTLWGTHRLARNLFHPRLALWLTALAGLFPPFYWASIEFRTDTLWAMLWIWALALLTAPALGAARGLAAGLILGAAFSVSMKSSLLLACLLAALAGAIALGHKTWPPLAVLRRYGSVALTTVAGLLVIPGALVAWFHAHGALGAMIYGVIQHNMLPQLGRSRDPRAIRHIAFTLVVMALLALAYRLFFRKAAEDERSEAGGSPARQGLLFLFTGIYLAAVHFLWPLITRQDYLPVWPLIVLFGVALVACPLLARLATVFEPRWDPATSHWPYLAAGLIELLILTATLPFYWRGSAQQDYRTWDAVLTLTTPAETVMDTKGNLIFRNRAEYWGLEKITRERMKRGLIPNLINQHLIETSTCVIQPDLREFPDRNQKFIEANYLSVGPLLVAGQRLKPDAAQPGQPIAFTVRIATDYTVLASGGEPARGLLDGQPCAGGRFLAAGAHAYQPAPGETGDFALLWRRAVEHDYRPAGFGKGR